MKLSISVIIHGLEVFTILIPLIIFCLDLNRQPNEIRWLAVLLLYAFFCDLLGPILFFNGSNPNYASTLYWLFSTILLSGFFMRILQIRSAGPFFISLNILYLIFAFSNALWIQKSMLNTYTVIAQSIIVLALSIRYFYKLLKELPTQQLHKLPLFWIVSAFFFTYAGKLVVYTVTHYLTHFEDDDLRIIWTFHNFLTIIVNLLIGYGAWINHKQLKSTSLSLSRS